MFTVGSLQELRDVKRFSPITALRYHLTLLPLDVFWTSLLKMDCVLPKKGK